MFSPAAFSQDSELYDEFSPSAADQDVLFKSFMPDVIPEAPQSTERELYYYDDTREYQDVDPDNMPLFKQIRLKLSNKFLESQYKNTGKEDDDASTIPAKWKFWQKNKDNETETQVKNSTDSELSEVLQSETSVDVSEDTLSLTGEINKSETEKEMILDSDNVTFDDETGDMIAKGRPVLDVPPQNMKVIADEMIYNEYSNILKGIGHVLVFKDGRATMGEYLEIDMNEETMIMDGVLSKSYGGDAKAEKAVQKDGLLILTKGNFSSDKSGIYTISTRVAGPSFASMMADPETQALFFGNPEGNELRLDIDSIYVDARKNHDVYRIKNAKIYHKDKYITRIPGLTVYTNKQRSYFEANYPELGSMRKVGMFIGPGFTFGGPFGSVVKLVPFLNYKDDFGIGGMVKYINSNNKTFLGYASANDIFFLKGDQHLDDNLTLHYGSNTYNNEWFLGGRMAKYIAELAYDKSYFKPNFLTKGMHLSFRHRATFGLMKDDDRNYNGEKIQSTNMSTTRTRYMAGIDQTLYSYRNKEKRISFSAGLALQGSAALYGTGDTQFIARFGPRVSMQYKNWMQSIGYYLTGFDDHTPMPIFDKYRYGTQSVYITEALRVNRYLSVGWSGYINLSDDSPNGKPFQENAFMVSLGPDDCRLIFGYDFTRQRTYFGINVAFDPKGTNINYGRMEIKNPERLGKQYKTEEDEAREHVAFIKNSQRPEVPASKLRKSDSTKPPVLEYATVINIEDPEKERIE